MGLKEALEWQPDPPGQAVQDDEVWPLLDDLLARDVGMAADPWHAPQRAALAALIAAAFNP
jgi:hypothetical protein